MSTRIYREPAQGYDPDYEIRVTTHPRTAGFIEIEQHIAGCQLKRITIGYETWQKIVAHASERISKGRPG